MSYRILFADQSQMINEVMQFALDTDYFTANTAQSYQRVYSLFNEKPYDLIIIDLEMNGLDLIERVKKSEYNSQTDIFIMSDKNDIDLKKNVKKIGASGWIEKPFIPEKLVKTILIYLQQKAKEQ